MNNKNVKHFLNLNELNKNDLNHILHFSKIIKNNKKNKHIFNSLLQNKMLAMIFSEPSTRTRISFEVGMKELGGKTIILSDKEMQIGRGETIADTAKILSRFVDIVMIRTLNHNILNELAKYSNIPVINGLTQISHPCQIMADILTFEEHKGSIQGSTIAWIGDSNNVLTSWIHASTIFDFQLNIATPNEYSPNILLIKESQKKGASIFLTDNPYRAVKNADCVITDCWVSMGDKFLEKKLKIFKKYQVNQKLMNQAKMNAIFMHCLPAHRNEEVTSDIIDGKNSVVFDEAENRLHIQKGILIWCLNINL